MSYNMFYQYPPRPENVIEPARLDRYEDGQWIAQPKYNGSCSVIVIDTGISVFNRHKELLKLYDRNIDFHSLVRFGPLILAGEIMNKSKLGEDGCKITGFIAWDILYLNASLVGKTIEQRLNLLDSVLPSVKGKHEYMINTKFTGIYKAPVFEKNFAELYKKLIEVDAYEGVVLKRKSSKLEFGFSEKNNTRWQVKARKETKNYKV